MINSCTSNKDITSINDNDDNNNNNNNSINNCNK